MAFKKEIVEIIEPRDIFVGNPDAPVTLMEFGEYENEACAKANEVVKQLLGRIRRQHTIQFPSFPPDKYPSAFHEGRRSCRWRSPGRKILGDA